MNSPLISAADLAARLAVQPSVWRVFDCHFDLTDATAGAREYADGHIPGAAYLNLDHQLSGEKTGHNGRHPLPRREDFAALMGRLGVSNDTPVVAYDDAGGIFAARLWWLMRWLGHERTQVLDGGLGAWLAGGGALSEETPQFAPQTFTPHAGFIPLDVDYVAAHLGQADMTLLDARAADRFAGENETLDPIGGHIPGALNRHFKLNLTAAGHFKPPPQLREEFAALLRGRAPTRVVQQCGSGVTACHNLLAMEVAGLSGSRLYPGSWSEWCADTARPMVTNKQIAP